MIILMVRKYNERGNERRTWERYPTKKVRSKIQLIEFADKLLLKNKVADYYIRRDGGKGDR